MHMTAIDVAGGATNGDCIWSAVVTKLQESSSEVEVVYEADGRRMVRRYDHSAIRS